LNIDEPNWKTEAKKFKPYVIIHAAWLGVEANDREDWDIQLKNVFFLHEIFDIARFSGTKKMIALGSQAEYGNTDFIVKETDKPSPNSAYGSVKLMMSSLIRLFCTENRIEWYWLRVFSIYGENESSKWLLPNVIKTMLVQSNSSMAFSLGEQNYAYLYAEDFVNAIMKVIIHKIDSSGVYNICSNKYESIKSIITTIRNKIRPDFILNFGELPYRIGQSMLIAGDVTKFINQFGAFENTDLETGISRVIDFYKKYN